MAYDTLRPFHANIVRDETKTDRVEWSSGVAFGLLTLRLWYRFWLLIKIGSSLGCTRRLPRCHKYSANRFLRGL